jgi:hypothetical protein
LKNKEKNTDVKVCQFIIDNHKKYRLFNYHNLVDLDISYCNHPSNILIMHYVNQILSLIGEEKVEYNGPELLIETTLVSRYDIDFYNYEWIQKESLNIDALLKQIIVEIYDRF